MKNMEASVLNKNSFDVFSSTHEPVMIGNKENPIGVFLNMHDLQDFLNTSESIKQEIKAGILRGVEDSRAGRTTRGGQTLINNLQKKLKKRLSSKT